eukprot:COSAG02_NODE_2000_length_10140_cov_14.090429_4_plen_105_part_00
MQLHLVDITMRPGFNSEWHHVVAVISQFEAPDALSSVYRYRALLPWHQREIVGWEPHKDHAKRLNVIIAIVIFAVATLAIPILRIISSIVTVCGGARQLTTAVP